MIFYRDILFRRPLYLPVTIRPLDVASFLWCSFATSTYL